jgi:hypothetical protein
MRNLFSLGTQVDPPKQSDLPKAMAAIQEVDDIWFL